MNNHGFTFFFFLNVHQLDKISPCFTKTMIKVLM